jgi:hypothetical protein
MDIKDLTGANGAGAGALSAAEETAYAELTASMAVPISEDLFKAALERGGADAKQLHAELDTCQRRKRPMRDADVDAVIRRGSRRHGRMDDNQAVVMAYYAQKHRGVFAPDSYKRLTRVFAKVEWNTLVAELQRFMAELQRQAEEARKAEEIKQERLKDDLKRDDAKRQLVKDNGTKADRQRDLLKADAQKSEIKERMRIASPGDVDEELTGSGKLPLSDVELTKLGLMKKGFGNRD